MKLKSKQNYRDRSQAVVGGRVITGSCVGLLLRKLGMFCILNWGRWSCREFPPVKIHQAVCSRHVHFTVCMLFFNNIITKKKIKKIIRVSKFKGLYIYPHIHNFHQMLVSNAAGGSINQYSLLKEQFARFSKSFKFIIPPLGLCLRNQSRGVQRQMCKGEMAAFFFLKNNKKSKVTI